MCTSPDFIIIYSNIHCFLSSLSFLCSFSLPKTMSPVFQTNNDHNSNSIRRSEFSHGIQRISVYGSTENRDDDDDFGSCSSSSIGRNSDVSGDSGSDDDDDSPEAEVQSQLKGPLDHLDALEEVLPLRKGISKFYHGKSKSFTSLADAAAASSVKDFAKPEDPYNRKRKNLLVHGYLLDKKRNNPLRNNGTELSKRVANTYRSTVALRTTTNSSEINSFASSPSSCLPPLHPHPHLQCRKTSTIRSLTPSTARQSPPCRSFSLSDLQFVAAAASPNIAGLAVHSGNKDNKMH